jgi:hypothetical protein
MAKNFFYKRSISGLACILFLGCILSAPIARAADLTVTPAVINMQGIPNDILNYTITVTNTSGKQQNVFASVYELTPSGTQAFADPSGSNRPMLLADWISVGRQAMLFQPGQSMTIPVTIQVNPYAAAGDYNAVIGFVEGSTRDQAEENLNGAPETLVNASIESDLTASMVIESFVSAKNFYAGFPVTFNYTLDNNGDVSSTPTGQVMFYDRNGRELGSADANPLAMTISPGEKQSFSAVWQKGGNFGQYKAVLDISYAANDDRLESTALVWVLPWKKILIIFGMLFILIIFFALWIHRQYEKRYHARRRLIEHLLKKKSFETTIDLRHPS